MAELDEILKRYTDPVTGSFHGVSFIAIDSKGNDIYRRSFGSRTLDRSTDDPLTLDTLTWIASQTKLTTSVSVMQLVEKGLVGLDDDVRELIPELKQQKVLIGFEGDDADADNQVDLGAIVKGGAGSGDDGAAQKPIGNPIFEDVKGKITFRHLLTHSSGLPYDLSHPLIQKYSTWANRKDNMFSGKIEGSIHPLVYQPGTSWAYSPGLDIAGRAVEIITGKDFDTYQQENIWDPLGAKSTTFRPVKHFAPDAPPPMQETAYWSATAASSNGIAKGESVWKVEPRDAIGGAGLYSTANDWSKLMAALIGGGAPILRPESLDVLFAPQLGAESVAALRTFVVGGSVELSLSRQWALSDDEYANIPEIQHSLAGTLNTEDIPGRRRKGTVNWGGLPNLSWWVDRESGVAATIFTQLMPPGGPKSRLLGVDLEEALFKIVRGGTATK